MHRKVGRPRNPVPDALIGESKEIISLFWETYDNQEIDLELRALMYQMGTSYVAAGWVLFVDSRRRNKDSVLGINYEKIEKIINNK